MLDDECLNGHSVIDMMSYYNIGELIQHSKVSEIINNIWSSPYKLKSLCHESSLVRICMDGVKCKSSLAFQNKNTYVDTVLHNFKHPWEYQKHDETDVISSNMFTYNVWKRSMFTKYVIHCIIVIAIAIYIQNQMGKLLVYAQDLELAYTNVATLQAEISSGMYAGSDLVAAQLQLQSYILVVSGNFNFTFSNNYYRIDF